MCSFSRLPYSIIHQLVMGVLSFLAQGQGLRAQLFPYLSSLPLQK